MDMKASKELVKFVIDIGMAVDKSLADGKIDMADVGNFMIALQSAGPAIADAKAALEFFKAPTVEAIEEMKAFIGQELQLQDAHLDGVVKHAITIICGLLEMLVMIKAKPAA